MYVAQFRDDGTGAWVALTHGMNGLTTANGFRDQADVAIRTRAAADAVKATPMDRPEWFAAVAVRGGLLQQFEGGVNSVGGMDGIRGRHGV